MSANVPVPPTVPAVIVFAPDMVAVEAAATCNVAPASFTCPGRLAPASVNVPASNSTVPVAAAPPKLPALVPVPARRISVPLDASTEPSFSSAANTCALLTPADLRNVPVLWNAGAAPEMFSETSAVKS